jgi:hypothetical protein
VDWAAWWSAHWEFVLGIVIGGAVGALINWIFYRKAEKPKKLVWDVKSANRIIHAEPTSASASRWSMTIRTWIIRTSPS